MSSPETTSQEVDTLIIGAGFAGLCMAIKLQQQGRSDFLVLEREADLGGTWLINDYPGCACDVHSHLYSYSFEPNPNWSRMFSPQQEIWQYQKHCAQKYGVEQAIRYGCNVRQARFDERSGRWQLQTDQGEHYSARVLISCIGGLDQASIPEFEGREDFQGAQFHSQRWDHSVDLQKQRVAVIGTGASAIQFVPQIQAKVARLSLFQRTAPWVLPKPDRAIGAREQRLFRRWPALQRAYRRFIYWFLESRVFAFVFRPGLLKLAEASGCWQIRKQIRDPALRAKVTPDFRLGCKRVLIANDYYPALAKDNVEVITTGIRRITATGVETSDGQQVAADVIIYGTGFKATDPLPRGFLIGRDGLDLLDRWQQGMEAYKGTTVSGFPNLFLINGPNTGLGHSSVIFTIESQVAYILDALRQMRQRQLRWVDVRRGVSDTYNRKLQDKLDGTIWQAGGCRSWYMNDRARNVALWPGFTFSFRRQTRRFDLENYEAQPAD